MENALWLLNASPAWIFFITPFAILCLLVGIIVAVTRHQLGLIQFILSFALSQTLVTLAGFFREKLDNPSGIMIAFFCIQFLICGILIYRLKESRIAASALTLISIIYAFFVCTKI